MADQDANKTTTETEGNVVYLWKIPIDKDFVKSIPSILKIAAACLSLVAFVCVASGRTEKCDDDYASTYNYFEFVSISSFLTLIIEWLFFALTIVTMRVCKIVPWLFGDIIILGAFSLLYLIANICVAAQDCGKDSNKAGVAFGFFTLFCMVGNAVLSLRSWLASRKAPSSQASSPEYNAERNMEQY